MAVGPGYFSVAFVVAKEADAMAKKQVDGEGNIRKEKTGGPEAKIPRPGLVFIPYGARVGSTANFAKSRNFSRNLWRQKVKKTVLNFARNQTVCDYGADLKQRPRVIELLSVCLSTAVQCFQGRF